MNLVLSIALAASLAALGWVSTVSNAKMETLQTELTSAQAETDRWRVTATALQSRVQGQNTLAAECIQREVDAMADVDVRENIMTLAPPVVIAPEDAQKGVSRETRRAAADYLNRPL